MHRDELSLLRQLEDEGYALCQQLVSAVDVQRLLDGLREMDDSVHARKREGATYALRNILNVVPAVKQMANESSFASFVRRILGPDSRPVKATLFDKTAEANWNLRWHQDNVIAVAQKIEVEGFHGWTEKTGIPHVRPPVAILEGMLAVRIHLDDCPASNGALMVIPASHKSGRLSDEELSSRVAAGPVMTVEALRGDALLMRPLLLHASRRSEQAAHRRVLHIEYAAEDLPSGLEWGE